MTGAWFYVASLKNFGPLAGAFAHTAIGFSFKDGESLALSIEARRRENEPYDPFVRGMFGVYPISYIWSTQEDFEERRTVFLNTNLIKYPLTLPTSTLQKLVVSSLHHTARNLENPATYNSLSHQCNIALLSEMNNVFSEKIPWHLYWHITGLTPRLLEKQGVIDFSQGEEIQPPNS